MKLPPEVLKRFIEAGRKGGLVGGKIAAANMTAAQRKARATKAVKAREAKRKGDSNG